MLSIPNGPELVFVVALALIVFGPKKLPEIGRTIGQGIRELRKASRELTDAFDLSGITSDLPKASDLLSDDGGEPDRSSAFEPEPELDTVSDFEPDRWDDKSDAAVEDEKENDQDVADSMGAEWTGTVGSPCDSDSALRSEEAAGDRQVDG